MHKTIIEWLEHRTGIQTIIQNFLYEEIPASSGWHQVIGSMAVFFFIIQVFTGGLLAFNYAPTPGEAYNSVKYIMTELTGGSLIRGLHHWGASMMLIIVVLHMLQVFLYGAYKKPREATWMVGVVLLLITLAFRTDGLFAALGQPRVLGNGGYHADRGTSPTRRPLSDAAAGRRVWRGQCHLLAILRAAHGAIAAVYVDPDRDPHLSGSQTRGHARGE